MSGRPANPSYTTRTFATDANYGAGPEAWNNQATKVEPADIAKGFTPDTGAAAEEENKLFYDAFTQDANAKTEIGKVLDWSGQIPALNFPLRVATPITGGDPTNGAMFVRATRKWYILGGNEKVYESSNAGHTWANVAGVGTAGLGEGAHTGDSDVSGNIVLSTSDGKVYTFASGTSTWALVSLTGAAASQTGKVVYDPISGRWIHARVFSNAASIQYSTDRASWLSGSAPAGSLTNNLLTLAVDKANGVTVFVGLFSGSPRAATSTDGFTSQTTIDFSSGVVSPTVLHLTHNAEEGAFYLVVGETSGTPSCEVWRSTNGIAWNMQAAITGMCLTKIGACGELLVAVTTAGDVVYSIDKGVTWKFSGFLVEGTPIGVFFGGNRPMLLSSTHLYMGLAAGIPDL